MEAATKERADETTDTEDNETKAQEEAEAKRASGTSSDGRGYMHAAFPLPRAA